MVKPIHLFIPTCSPNAKQDKTTTQTYDNELNGYTIDKGKDFIAETKKAVEKRYKQNPEITKRLCNRARSLKSFAPLFNNRTANPLIKVPRIIEPYASITSFIFRNRSEL